MSLTAGSWAFFFVPRQTMFKKLFLFFLLMAVLGAAAIGGVVYWYVVVVPGDEIDIENIKKILGKESEVYYSDGTTKLGVFFDTAHRQYVRYDEIPKDFVNALVASEDDRFFSHFGFDPIGIARAMVKNIQAGRIVQGGSTLTQQTAKNLFKRTDRSIEAKLKELIYALRLEYRYSKEQIFEFYANQFYVSGNGHGLGVAARYYFDKSPEELNLVECAFIAGSVKRPNYYNPFIKKSHEAAELAKIRGRERLQYVLGKMQQLGMIDSFAYNKALTTDLEFKQGQVGFALDYAMELVRDAVGTTEVVGALQTHDIENIATSGVKIITTIDRELQRQSLAVLRGELSRLDVRLRGYDRAEVQKELDELDYEGDSEVETGAFLFGEIAGISGKGKDIRVDIDLGPKRAAGIVDQEGLAKLLLAFVKYRDNLWTEVQPGDQQQLVAQLQKGDRVWVSVREQSTSGEVLLNLEKYPKVQGGALVLREGRIKGIIGGSENRFFNRAIQAQRTMGSAFKPLVYTAALQLGWNSTDLLRNQRDVFVYHGMPYFPRPDHISPHKYVSMSWAGVHSENVASVWLVSHLCDQLSPIQFHEVAEHLGLTPKNVNGETEPYRAYSTRIRDRYGILVNRDMLRSAAYRMAVKNLETDFIFDNIADQYEQLKDLHYGLGFNKFHLELNSELELTSSELRNSEIQELELRKKILANNFLLLEHLHTEMQSLRRDIENTTDYDPFSAFGVTPSGIMMYDKQSEVFHFLSRNSDPKTAQVVNREQLAKYLASLDIDQKEEFWRKVVLNRTITVEAFEKVAAQLELEEKKLGEQLPYSFEVLSQIEDFRITVGLHYIVALAHQLGIRSQLEPVLSLPLGSNVVSLLEATRMYEGFATGEVVSFGSGDGDEFNDSLAVIDRIELEDGTVVYQPTPNIRGVINNKIRLEISNILENVVKFGTGRSANEKVQLTASDTPASKEIEELHPALPLLGKTGTANRYTNASFFGYLPEIDQSGTAMKVENGYAIGVYVGFDDNQPMRRRSSRIAGSAGALPSWCKITNVLLQEHRFIDRLDPVDLSFYGLRIVWPDLGQLNLAVDPEQGGVVREPVQLVSDVDRFQPSILSFGRRSDAGRFIPERDYAPFWQN
jgi:penicillin-binding protein 1A